MFQAPALVELVRHGELVNDLQVQAVLVSVRYDDEHQPGDAILIVNWRSTEPPKRSYRQVHHFSAAIHDDPIGHANTLMHDLIKQGPVPDGKAQRHTSARRTTKRRARATA